MLKVLYIDNRAPSHNRDSHIDFIVSLKKNKIFDIIGYGSGPARTELKTFPFSGNTSEDLFNIVKKEKPNAILTYNRNGSSKGFDNISTYRYAESFLKNIELPKFHITSDYCRTKFDQNQADWFKHLNYSAAIFRHKESLKHPIDIPAYWLPFSIDRSTYLKGSLPNHSLKRNKVGFIGSAHDSLKDIYAPRISAIDFLLKKDMLKTTRVIGDNFKRQMLFGLDYVRFLTQNKYNLTCGGSCNFFTAKYLQIPAANSMLICTNTTGIELLPVDTYIAYDSNNLDIILEKIEFFHKNTKEYKDRVVFANKYVLKNHNNKKRGLELLSIIRDNI